MTDQLSSEAALLSEDQVGQPAGGRLFQFPGFLREHGFVRMPNGRHAHRIVLKQSLDDLHAHLPVQAVHRLGRGVSEHIEDASGITGDGLSGLVGVEDDLRTTQDHPYDQRREQHHAQQLYRQAVSEFQLQMVIP